MADGVVQSTAFRICAMHAARDLRRLCAAIRPLRRAAVRAINSDGEHWALVSIGHPVHDSFTSGDLSALLDVYREANRVPPGTQGRPVIPDKE